MVHGLAATGLEFRRAASRHLRRQLLGPEAAWARHASSAGAGARVQVDRTPKNSATGFVTAFFAVVTGFALIWHIWWMAGVGLLGAFVTLLAFAFRDKEEVEIPAALIARFDRIRKAEVRP